MGGIRRFASDRRKAYVKAVAEQEFRQALSRISLDDVVQRAARQKEIQDEDVSQA
jgi:hypothetical protein